jgi:hypothetical protein
VRARTWAEGVAAGALALVVLLLLIYMEDLGGARDGVIDAAPPPYEVR